MNLILSFVSIFLMLILPLILGELIHRRLAVRWTLFGIGAATFIGSQAGHIPFNLAVLIGLEDFLETQSVGSRIVLLALFAGLSSGIFEEGSRYLMYRYWARDARTWRRGLMLGAGHGGAESIILGILLFLNVGFFLGFREGQFTNLPNTEEIALIQQTITQVEGAIWYESLLPALERILAMVLHLGLSIMVMNAHARRKIRWLVAAVAWHAAANALALVTATYLGNLAAEALLLLFAICTLLFLKHSYHADSQSMPHLPLPAQPPIERANKKPGEDDLDSSRFM